MFKKYYKILDLPDNSSDEEVKRAYKKLAVKYHPDKNSEKAAEEKFKKISEAYEILTNKDKYASKIIQENQGSNLVNQNDLLAQLFRNMSMSSGINNFPHGFHGVNIGIPGVNIGIPTSNVSNRSTTVTFQNGKKIVTIRETKNGRTVEKTIISDM